MANYQIPISYVVSASAVLPQAGLEPLQLSTILILSDDEPVQEIQGSYEIYRTATSAVRMWGTESTTTRMVQSIFGQSPNILNNNGYVIVAPFNNTPDTSGKLTTKTIDVENFKTIEDGVLNLTIDGTQQQLVELNFSEVTNVSEIAGVINGKIQGAIVTAEDDALIITSLTAGNDSKVAINVATESGTDLYGANYLDGAAAVVINGLVGIKEAYDAAITRLSSEIYFNAITTTRVLSDSEIKDASNTVEALNPARILFVESANLNSLDSEGIFKAVETNMYTKTLFYTQGSDAAITAKLFAAGYMSKLLSVNYNGSNTCITMNLKDLSGISADTNISETILEKCKGVGCDVYASVEGLPKVISNRKGAYYSDQIQNLIWFVNTIQRNVFNLLATTRTKIPQTESGMQLITNSIGQVCNQAIRNGYLAPGAWNSADTFGEYEDFMRNITENGFYIYHLPVADQIQSEREERRAPMFQIAGKEAGAVHSANILIYVEP